jgi:hypothetical protein
VDNHNIKNQKLMAIKTKQEIKLKEAEMEGGYLVEVSATSVGRYLQNKPPKEITSVNRYLAKQILELKNTPIATGVKKYLMKRSLVLKDSSASRVSKYIVKQHAKGNNTRSSSSVSKYIFKKLLEAREKAPKTGVAKYLAKIEASKKKADALALIERYQTQEAAEAKIKAEIEAQKTEVLDQHEDQSASEVSGSSVSQYLGGKKDVAVSGVARYLANQIVRNKNKASSSSVDKYLKRQILSQKLEQNKSSVERYLKSRTGSGEKQTTRTSVSKYLTKKKILGSFPGSSSVSKYLARKSALATKLKLLSSGGNSQSLEGQLILANETSSNTGTGVEKYLDKRHKSTTKIPKMSGVEKYLRSK